MDFEVIKLPPGAPIMMDDPRFVMELRPTKMYVLPDGTLNGQPSYAFVLQGPWGEIFVAQISDKMLREGMRRAQLSVLPHIPNSGQAGPDTTERPEQPHNTSP